MQLSRLVRRLPNASQSLTVPPKARNGSLRAYSSSPGALTHLLVLDFEATCQRWKPFRHEIIEFPTLIYDLEKNAVTGSFHEYVRPELNPKLTPYCTDLTGIQQATVDSADSFPEVWARFLEFLNTHGFTEDAQSTSAFLTCGNWDLKDMLPDQILISKLPPLDERFKRWLNLKEEYPNAFSSTGKRVRNRGMVYYLHSLGLELEGRHHSGIDDCKNIARIVTKMRENGWTPQFSEGDTNTAEK